MIKPRNSHYRRYLLGVGACLSLAVGAVHGAVVYNFDDLTQGNLTTSNTSGQDGWYRDAALGGPDLQVSSSPVGGPTTNVVTVTYGNPTGRAVRQFGESFFSSDTEIAEVSFTFQKTPLTVSLAFALGNGATPTSFINGNSPSSFSPRLVLANGNQFGITPKTTAGNFGSNVLSSAQSLTVGDWYTVTMTLDFTANGGDGSGSLSYVNLTTNERFDNILTGVNLGLTNNPTTTQPDDWNQVWMRVDQLTSSGPAGTAAFAQFSIAAVPEPTSSSALVGACLRRPDATRTV